MVSYIEAGVDWDGKPSILMPLIEGMNLREAVAGHDLEMILHVFEEILRSCCKNVSGKPIQQQANHADLNHRRTVDG